MVTIRINEPTGSTKARELAISILQKGLDAADPKAAVERCVEENGDLISFRDTTEKSIPKYDSKEGKIYVVGAGKASGAMAEKIEEILRPDTITEGMVNILKCTKDRFKTKKITLNEASHPLPDKQGVEGAKKIIEIVTKAQKDDLVICLISGGGSALMSLPAPEVPLEDKVWLIQKLLKAGADIVELNIVRKHLSKIKGGQLAKAAATNPDGTPKPGSGPMVVSLIMSDVVGDDLSSIASGPTSPDPSKFKDARDVLERYNLWDQCCIPQSIRDYIEQGIANLAVANPGPADPIFDKVYNLIICSNRTSLEAMRDVARASQANANVIILNSFLEGEAREIGKFFGGIAKTIHEYNDPPLNRPVVILAGGETTVMVTGRGLGGRNQELALSALLSFEKEMQDIVIAGFASDGIEGETDAAGAIVDAGTVEAYKRLGLRPLDYLLNNDSYHFFSQVGDLLMTGPTGTNVNDFVILLAL